MGPSQFRKLFGESDGPARGEMRGQGEAPGCIPVGLVALGVATILASVSLAFPRQCSGESQRTRGRETSPTQPESPVSGEATK